MYGYTKAAVTLLSNKIFGHSAVTLPRRESLYSALFTLIHDLINGKPDIIVLYQVREYIMLRL